jgi:hypothetical protein
MASKSPRILDSQESATDADLCSALEGALTGFGHHVPLIRGLSVILVALFLFSGAAVAKTRLDDFGKREFEANCASCHGSTGRGVDHSDTLLRGKRPPDLRMLRKNNAGIFPINRVYESITGANVAGHGSRDMPIWSDEYLHKAQQNAYDTETWVRIRILALIEYIERLQR